VRGLEGDAFGYTTFRVQNPNGMGYVDLKAEQVLEFHGYDPDSERDGSSPIHALKEVLSEQLKALAYRNKVWERGGRVSSVIERPAGVRWSDDQRRSFKKDWNAKFVGDGSQVGGTPILEDGMKLVKMGSDEAVAQFVEASKLSLQTVAQVYQINPTMVGLLDNANYSNVKEFRKMLYGDALGPMLKMIMDRLNAFLLPRLGVTDDRVYLEFNIAEKLRGDFEQQAASYQTAVGGPWMTRAEARARNNLPALPEDEEADQLIVPLNVLVGGQASPTDSAPPEQPGEGESQPEQQPKALKSAPNRAPSAWESKTETTLRDIFVKQKQVALSRKGAKDALWWDEKRWEKELFKALSGLGVFVSEVAAHLVLQKTGLDPEVYDVDRTAAYFRQVATTSARKINERTFAMLSKDAEEFDPDSRARGIAPGLVTRWSAFGVEEAGRQQGATTKTWVTGPNARDQHKALDGETVPIDGFFSDGTARPGNLPHCNCTLEIGFSRR
jgi:HK97 family phage portal protein